MITCTDSNALGRYDIQSRIILIFRDTFSAGVDAQGVVYIVGCGIYTLSPTGHSLCIFLRNHMSKRAQVGSTQIEDWNTDQYPEFVTEGTGDQKGIMAAICKIKKATFNGVDCVGENATATGTVRHFARKVHTVR